MAIALLTIAFSSAAGPLNQVPDMSSTLRRWERFPVHLSPRPILLLSDLPVSEGGAKSISRLSPSVDLPAAPPPPARVGLPDGPAMLRQVSAREAYQRLTTALEGDRYRRDSGTVSGFHLTNSTFMSDRGPLALPAWIFELRGGGTLSWPALAPTAFWPDRHVGPSGEISEARADASGTTITAWLPIPHGGCGGDGIDALRRVTESDQAVAVSTFRSRPRTGDSRCVVPADLRLSPYRLLLKRPLGNRVLTDEYGQPVMVTPTGSAGTHLAPWPSLGTPRPSPTAS
ncbi:hypothetical protein [Sphaerisporangium krabiense]|uniref:Uncharacterized protein n=1 Tax=Sphaerisporangium krabiense TaxID=763782 RepID=A0A7W8Z9L2_9ACTN|nr:hypothetical protein [Sphaerisporangium krabiense]MBB5629593.1 hypothetical protein [Sphaerisporangium krabiense]